MPKIKEFNATGSSQKVTLYRGVYQFECWGASGGDEGTIKGASGTYVSGVLSLYKRTVFMSMLEKKEFMEYLHHLMEVEKGQIQVEAVAVPLI